MGIHNEIAGSTRHAPRQVWFANYNYNTTVGSRTRVFALTNGKVNKQAVTAALLGGTVCYDPRQSEIIGLAGTPAGEPVVIRPQVEVFGTPKALITEVVQVTDEGNALCEVVEAIWDQEAQIASGVDLTEGVTILMVQNNSFVLTPIIQGGTATIRTDTIANNSTDRSSIQARGVAIALTTIASGANTAVTRRRVAFGGIGGPIRAA